MPDTVSLYIIAHTHTWSYLVLRELQIEAELNFTALICGEEVLTFFCDVPYQKSYGCKFSSGLILNVLFTDLHITVGCSWQDFDP